MRKFFLKIVLLLLPIGISLGYIEYRLSQMPNSYQIKRKLFEKALPEIEILILGSSNAYYGIDPAYFELKGFNFAFRAQSHWYDTRLALKYLDRMPKLKIVLIPVIYLTFGTELTDIADKWRVFFYDQAFNVPPRLKLIKDSYGWYYWLDPKRFSLIALYGERTPDFVRRKFKDDIGEKMEPNGWFDAGEKPMDPSLKIGPTGGAAHNNLVNTRRYSENLEQIQPLIDELKKRNIVPVLLQLPAHREISEYWDKGKLFLMDRTIENFAHENELQSFNYRNDPRFIAADFTDMPDHLNSRGAKKISVIINHDIILPILAQRRTGR